MRGITSSSLMMAYLQQAKLLEFWLWSGIREPLECRPASFLGAASIGHTSTHARSVHHILEVHFLHFGKFIFNGLSTVAFNDALRHSCIFLLQGGRVGNGFACCTMLCFGFGFDFSLGFGGRQQLNPRDTNAKPNATQPFTKLIYGTSWQRKH